MTINLTDPANQLTEELQLTPERLTDNWPDKLTWSHHDDMTQAEVLAWNNAIDACRAAMLHSNPEPAPQPSRMSGIMPDYEGVAMTQRECYMAGKEAGLAEARKSPVIPDGYALVPVAYADPRALSNFEARSATREWMWARSDSGLIPLYTALAIPDGWAMVPVEPTHEMLDAGDAQFGTYDMYRRMIEAAPKEVG